MSQTCIKRHSDNRTYVVIATHPDGSVTINDGLGTILRPGEFKIVPCPKDPEPEYPDHREPEEDDDGPTGP